MFHYVQYRDGSPLRWIVIGDEVEDLDVAVAMAAFFKSENPEFPDEDVRIVSYFAPMTVEAIEAS